MQESDGTRNFSGVGFPAKLGTVAVVVVEMWEPAFGAGFQAPWDGQQSFGKDFRYRSHGASFPQRTRNSAHFGANVVAQRRVRPKPLFSENRVERTVLQIVVQSRKEIHAKRKRDSSRAATRTRCLGVQVARTGR